MNTKAIWAGVVLIVLIGGVVWYMQRDASLPNGEGTTEEEMEDAENGTQQGANGDTSSGDTSANPPSPAPTETYTSVAYGFSFQYPSALSTETSGFSSGFSQQGAAGVIAVYAQLGTIVDRLTISVSSEPSDLGSCTDLPAPTDTETIGGVIFTTHSSTEQVQGQVVTTTVYRTEHNTACYELRDVVTSTEPSRLPLEQVEAQRANIAAAAALMNTVKTTFRFTQ